MLVVLPVLYLATVIALATIRDYKPEPQEQISKIDDDFLLSDSATYSVLIWNIGYSGLGAGMDFFTMEAKWCATKKKMCVRTCRIS